MQNVRIAVKLAENLFDGDDFGAKWVMVTREGDFPGYMGGLRPFVFTRQNLEQMVANVKAHASYAVDASGVAIGQVIPWDFNHASEADPTTGALPVQGAPAQGWTLDMEVRAGGNGKAELWALTHFLEPARTYVKTDQYLWASVSVAMNATNVETNQPIGSIVTSIALTNTPVVEGMERLVASDPHAGATVQAGRMFFEAARDPSDAINMLRDMFGLLETAGAPEVMAQVAIVQSWIESGTAPLGTDPEELIGNMRAILNLPALTPQAMVIVEASSSIQALLEEQATAAGVPATAETPGGDGIVPEPLMNMIEAAQRREEIHMDELIKVFASLLGVRENEASIKTAVTELAQLRDSLTLAMGLNRDGAAIILAAAKDGVDAKERLLGILSALDVQDPEAALAKIAAGIQSSAKLLEVMPELEGLQAEAAKTEETAIAADVDAQIAAGKAPAALRGALVLQRTTEPEAFLLAFPEAPAAASPKAHLLSRVAGGAGGTDPTLSTGSPVVNLAQYPGANLTARAKMHLASTVANWADLSNEQQFTRAVAFKKQPNVIDQAIA